MRLIYCVGGSGSNGEALSHYRRLVAVNLVFFALGESEIRNGASP